MVSDISSRLLNLFLIVVTAGNPDLHKYLYVVENGIKFFKASLVNDKNARNRLFIYIHVYIGNPKFVLILFLNTLITKKKNTLVSYFMY